MPKDLNHSMKTGKPGPWRAAAKLLEAGAKKPRLKKKPSKLVGSGRLVGLPRRPWVASQQYSMRFILSADNEILVRADHLPIEILRAMAEAANTWQPNTSDERRGEKGHD